MKQPGFQASDPQPLESSRVRRARGYHRPGRLLLVALLLVLAFAGAVGFIWGVAAMLLTDDRERGWLALAGLGVFVLARVAVFMLASALSCPLCHGTVMLEKRCRKHEDAFRLGPLSHRLEDGAGAVTAFSACSQTRAAKQHQGQRSRMKMHSNAGKPYPAPRAKAGQRN